jgi:two-component system sensor histidine kinase TorS
MLLMTFVVIAGLPTLSGLLGWFELQEVARNQSKVINETIPAISEVRGFTETSSRVVAVAPELAAVTTDAARRERANYLFTQVDALTARVERYEATGNTVPSGLVEAERNVRDGIETLDRLVQGRIIAMTAQGARLQSGLSATTELLEIADTLVANAQMGTSAGIAHLYELEDRGPDAAARLDTLDRLIEVDLFRQGLMSEMRSQVGEAGLLLNRISAVKNHSDLRKLQAELSDRIDILTRRILSVDDPVRAKRALVLLRMIRPSHSPPPDADDLLNLTRGILDLDRLIFQAQTSVRQAAARLDTEAQALADQITTRAVRAGEDAASAIRTTQQLYAWGSIAAFLVSLAVMWVYVRGNITRRLDALSSTMIRLADGEDVDRITPEGLDEIAGMEASVEVFRLQGIDNRALEVERAQNLVELRRHRNELQSLVFEQTEQLRGEVEAHAAARHLAEGADRAKSEFLAMMSHEIRTPMNGVLGMLRSLGHDGLTPRQQEQLRAAHVSGEGLMAILNDILDYSKIEAGAATLTEITFSPGDLLRDIGALMSPSAQEKGLVLTVDLPETLPAAVFADLGKLRQILFNLVSNAVKFTDCGEVRLKMAATDRNGKTDLVITVSDTGKGIAAAAHERIFGVFEQEDAQTARQYGGTGLGLAICRRFAEAMGAELTVHSEPGVGTEFTLRATFATASAADLPVDRSNLPPPPKMPRLRVLVVEDNDINQMVILTYLEDMGHTVQLVDTAEAALVAIQETRFDVVLMDVNLPALSGTAATRAIRAMADPYVSTVPIIGISAHVQEAERRENLAAGMSAVLSKPLSPEALWSALRDQVPHVSALQALVLDLGVGRAVDLTRMFQQGCPTALATITRAFDARDHKALGLAAHQLVGGAGNFHLPDLTAHLRLIERQARSGISAELAVSVQELPGLIAASCQALETALGELDSRINQAAQ